MRGDITILQQLPTTHTCCVFGAKQTPIQIPPVPFTSSVILDKLHLICRRGDLFLRRVFPRIKSDNVEKHPAQNLGNNRLAINDSC